MKRVFTFTLSVLAVLLLVSSGYTSDSDFQIRGKFRGAKHRCDTLPNKAARAFCTAHALHVGPSADGVALSLLDKRFDLQFLDEEGDPDELRPTLVGPHELTRANWVVLLQEAYEAGHTIGLTNASPVDVDRFYHAVGIQNGCGQEMGEVLPLIALQKANTRRQTQHFTYAMLPRQNVVTLPVQGLGKATKRGLRRADRTAQQWLRARFSGSPPRANLDTTDCSNPQNCLVNLASSTACFWLQQNERGDSIAVNNFIWGTRSFEQDRDYYYVEQEIQYSIDALPVLKNRVYTAMNRLTDPTVVPATISPSPGTTSCSTSTTSGVSFSFGGNAGYKQGFFSGFNVTPVNVGMDISNSTTITCPSLQITYGGNPAEGTTDWTYKFELSNTGQDTLTVTNHWIWAVDFDEYASAQSSVEFSTDAVLAWHFGQDNPLVILDVMNRVPLPFNTFTLELPVVEKVDPTTVKLGQQFEIIGSGLYPSLVTAVQLGGDALPTGNFTPTDDTEITVCGAELGEHRHPVRGCADQPRSVQYRCHD